MLRQVEQTIERHGMFARGERVGVAVSGGADSVCLLQVLVELARRWSLTLSVLHVNHNLRGAESQGDAAFVRELACSLGLPFVLHELDLAGTPGNLEAAAREARLAFFHHRIHTGDVTRVALGHTRSDQAETVLFRLLRGSGVTGLAAIRPLTEAGLVRPLLDVDRGAVERFLRVRGLAWREDSTNRSRDFARNRIRHDLLPQLTREWNPALTETLAHTADISLAEEEFWQTEMERLAALHLTRDGAGVRISAAALTALPLAAARRLVRYAMQVTPRGGAGADFEHVTDVLELAGRKSGTGRVQVPGLEVLRSFGELRFGVPGDGRSFELWVSVPGRTRVPGTNLCISLEMLENGETSPSLDYVYNNQMGCLDWNRLSGRLKLRSWQPGDQYRPFGVPAAKKIKALFQQARIPVWERTQWPVLTDAESIVWTRRFGAAAAVAADRGCSKILAVSEAECR
ncbi:MAG: tRNA lysidine(34) synthetase TilS [Candidatus Solibacter sp.]